MKTNLYRHFDAEGALLYVGISLSAVYRLSQHMHASDWAEEIARVEIESFDTREEAIEAERAAIEAESPRHNIQGSLINGTANRTRVGPSESDIALLKQVVNFQPIYSPKDMAKLLNIREGFIREEIGRGACGSFVQPRETFTSNQIYPKVYVTGWQLLEYIEYLETAYSTASVPQDQLDPSFRGTDQESGGNVSD